MIKYGFIFYLVTGIFLLGIYSCGKKSSKNQYGLNIIQNFDRYKSMADKNPDKAFVDLETYIPGVVLDTGTPQKIISQSKKSMIHPAPLPENLSRRP
jgi:hypothetical protein